MNVFLGSERITLKDTMLLGEGGEARVYAHRALALKVFHPATDALAKKVLAQKLEKLNRFPPGLPPTVLRPEALLRDERGETVGYAMKAVTQAIELGRLANRKSKWPGAKVMALFTALHRVLSELHAKQVVVGDLNDGNVLVRDLVPHLIDTDSMQLGGVPCAVGHERFLDPLLYGVDLPSGCHFSEGSDWYAFAVLLFQSLLSVHPFGGTHASLRTTLRRAEARHSVFQSDVKVPKSAVPTSVLPDDLSHWFLSVLERDERSTFPPSLLASSWTVCRCGTEHARAVCPECHALGDPLTRPVVRIRGRCTARVAVETTGRIVAAANQGGLRFVVEERGALRREDGTSLPTQLPLTALEAWVAGPVTWLCDAEGHVERWQGDRLSERASTTVRARRPIFAASVTCAVREEGGSLFELESGQRLGSVLEGQSWVWAGERLGLSLYRAQGLTVCSLFRPGKAGLKRLESVTLSGRLLDASAVFDARHALLTVTTERNGHEETARWLFDETGACLGFAADSPRGSAALLSGRVVLCTDHGLVALKRAHTHLIEGASFPDTVGLVGAQDELLANADGSLFVVGAREITQLTLT